jgi:hypothetical protein
MVTMLQTTALPRMRYYGLTNTLATAPQSEEQKRATWEQQAIKGLGEPEDITGAILFSQVTMWRSSPGRQLS